MIPVKRMTIPPEFQNISPDDIESFLGQQLAVFANGLAHRLAQAGYHVPADLYTSASREVFQLMTCKPEGPAADKRELQLVFRHDCLALGCLLSSCHLCQHNPNRRCAVNLDRKYLVNDVLKAKCQATIRVEVVDYVTNEPIDEDLGQNILLQMAILDGNAYDAKHEAGRENDFDLKSCMLLTNNKQTPLLVGSGVNNDPEGFVIVPLHRSKAVLPELRVTDSSEAMLSGRKPPLRLMMRAVYADTMQQVPHIRHAISEGFVVATRRTRTAGKADIPSVDDHVSKLEHMGKETVKKLSDVLDAGRQAGLDDLHLPGFPPGVVCIDKVGQFRKLALIAEQDTHLRQRLQQILKLSKDKWEDARDHALRAVVVDNRMRVWWSAPAGNYPRTGLVFTCSKGSVDLERPIGITTDGRNIKFTTHLLQHESEAVRQLQPVALSQWWQHKHPGWEIAEWDSEAFKADRSLVKCVLDESAGEGMSGRLDHSGRVDGGHSGLSGHSAPSGSRVWERDNDEPIYLRCTPQADARNSRAVPSARDRLPLTREPLLASPPDPRLDQRFHSRGHSAPINSQHLFRMRTAFDDRSEVTLHRDSVLDAALENLTSSPANMTDLDGSHIDAGMHKSAGMLQHDGRRIDPRVSMLEGRIGALTAPLVGLSHIDAAPHPPHPPPDVHPNLSDLKSEELGIDFMPSMHLNSMTMQPSLDMLARPQGLEQSGGALTLGTLDMQTDDWMQTGGTLNRDSLNIAQLSRNASGLDTMQSIEQALPEDLHSHAMRAQNASLQH